MPDYHFATPDPTELYVELGRGSVRVEARDTATTDVSVTGSQADDVRVDFSGDSVTVVGPREGLSGLLSGGPRIEVVVSLPSRSRLVTRLGSADLVVTGTVGASKLKSGSGDIEVATLTEASGVQSGSGDISIERAEGHLKIQSGSGDVTLGAAAAEASISTGSGDVAIGDASATTVVKTGSGDLRITTAAADAAYNTASGDLLVRAARKGRIVTKSASGEVEIGVPAGVPVWTDIHTVTGRIRSTLQGAGQPEPGQDHVELRTTTVSGDITLTQV